MNKKNEEYLENYEHISDEIKHITNSIVRLQLLFSLFEGNKSMKELNEDTGLSYSSISSNIHLLETNQYVKRDDNRYFLSNVMKIYIRNLMEFNKTIHILQEFFNLFENHKVRNISINSISELCMVENSKLLESSGTNAYKINKVILDAVEKSDSIKAILPISFQDLREKIEEFAASDKKVEIKLSHDIFDDFTRNIDLDLPNVKIKEFKNDFNFLLILANDMMIFGLYRKDGSYDQNRIMVSKSSEGLKWANKLFNTI
ncbi:MAG: DUF1724 domain-containing protein [Methanobrevibacter sp.]|uniref:helix-turn-helix transcriptional regulator n=1 Tax=Methanobrevibacter sp. TaxID=66852 RepID=UPI0026DECA28|nr:transcriptional regulator FilR1 domain-containing protein [Methanobrevibacter sp.]MDO5848876.1 DUF1724 domain-containing protein [Methanobrevibacter sp.]